MNIHRAIRTLYLILGLVLIAAIGTGGYFAYQWFAGITQKAGEVAKDTGNFVSGKPTEHGAEIGEQCTVGADCKGYLSALSTDVGVACCGGVCAKTVKDFANVSYCPAECKGWAGAPGGTCGPKSADGESCVAHQQCANWNGAGQQGSGCDQGKCTPMEKDWAGVWYIPSECKGAAGAAGGTCGSNLPDGAACVAHQQCANWNGAGQQGSGCDQGKCTPMEKDWAGVWYIPSECKGAAGAAGGTCGSNLPDGAACVAHQQCANWNGAGQQGSGCDQGKCTPMEKDWAGVWYIPSECKGAAGAAGGTCGSNLPDGAACVAHQQCANWHGAGQQGSGCDRGKCTPMKKDWAGVWYLPSECKKGAFEKAGSC